MAVIDTGLSIRGLRAEFDQAYRDTASYWRDLCTVIKSNTDTERYAWMGSVPQMREWGTGRKAKGLFSKSYSIKNLKYESTIEVDRDEIADDQLGQIRARVQSLAARARAAFPDPTRRCSTAGGSFHFPRSTLHSKQ